MTHYDYLQRHFKHLVWADNACVDAAATVPAGNFDKPLGFGFGAGTVHATLVHMLAAQEGWLVRLRGVDPVMSKPEDLPTISDIKTRWAKVHGDWQSLLAGQNETTLDAPVEIMRFGQKFRSTLRIVIGHLFDHATHHRGQLNSLIKLAGGTPGDYGQMTWSRQIGETGSA